MMNPRYIFTPSVVRDLMEIAAERQGVQLTMLQPTTAGALQRMGCVPAFVGG